tara:strand:- start:371 stop:667 length:297 start_codon:yes stop_codon:yes gene_type:complete
MRSQKRHSDGLIWIGKLFRPTIFKRILYRVVSPFMLKKDPKSMGRGIRRMPFRKGLKRDDWKPSEAAELVAKQWKNIRSQGGKTSFENDSDIASIPEP